MNNSCKIAIIGLGYVGFPLAVEFGKKYKTVGFDIDKDRIQELKSGVDSTLEVTKNSLKSSKYLIYTNILRGIKDCDVYIITVPTPIDKFLNPDLSLLVKATKSVGKVLSSQNIVIYESTVYPGATEEVCALVLEKESKLKFNRDFYCGYSPERINPGDKKHSIRNIVKVTSGSTVSSAKKIDNLYKSIIDAGTYLAPSIKVAEAAKVIENTQRDVNIALINELAILFNKLELDTHSILRAASTKWNFLKFTPGLVGGHCIGVDPYYLTHKAQSVGYIPDLILKGRKLNNSMPSFIAAQVVKLMMKNNLRAKKNKVLILGVTFKENCPDIRNSKVADLVSELEDFGCLVDVCDPLANSKEVKSEYHFELKSLHRIRAYSYYNCAILAVAHSYFIKNIDFQNFKKNGCLVYDVKGVIDEKDISHRL